MAQRQVQDPDVVGPGVPDGPVDARDDVGGVARSVRRQGPYGDELRSGGQPLEGAERQAVARREPVAVQDARDVRPVAEVVGEAGLVPDDLDLDDRLRSNGTLEVGVQLHAGVDEGDADPLAGQPAAPPSRRRGGQVGPGGAVGHVQVRLHGGVERDPLHVRIGGQVLDRAGRNGGRIARYARVGRAEQAAQVLQQAQVAGIGRAVGLHDHVHLLVGRSVDDPQQVARELAEEPRHRRQQLRRRRQQRIEQARLGRLDGDERQDDSKDGDGGGFPRKATLYEHACPERSKASANRPPAVGFAESSRYARVSSGGPEEAAGPRAGPSCRASGQPVAFRAWRGPANPRRCGTWRSLPRLWTASVQGLATAKRA